MKKHTLLIVAFFITIFVGLTGWKIYDNKGNETETETEPEIVATSNPPKIYTVADILKDADFSVEETALIINPDLSDNQNIIVENEEQRKRFINELANLKLKKSVHSYLLSESKYIKVTLNKDYSFHLFEKEKNIFFSGDKIGVTYDIVEGEGFFEILDEVLN